jgi:hypothetical protein
MTQAIIRVMTQQASGTLSPDEVVMTAGGSGVTGSDKEGHTPRQTIRVDAEDWDEFGTRVGPKERSRVVREFIAWYLRKPGAKLPERPPRLAAGGGE